MPLPDFMCEAILKLLLMKLDPVVIYLFGSSAQGYSRADSDIDLAYLGGGSLSPYEQFSIAQEAASLVQKDVDLIDLKTASTVFQTQIITNGKILYCSDEKKRIQFEMLTLKKYAKLNEERIEILEQIEKRGRVLE